MLRVDTSAGRFLCEVRQAGDIGSTLVVGEFGNDISMMPRSNSEWRGFDGGELGADDDKSDGLSETIDHLPFDGISMPGASFLGDVGKDP